MEIVPKNKLLYYLLKKNLLPDNICMWDVSSTFMLSSNSSTHTSPRDWIDKSDDNNKQKNVNVERQYKGNLRL